MLWTAGIRLAGDPAMWFLKIWAEGWPLDWWRLLPGLCWVAWPGLKSLTTICIPLKLSERRLSGHFVAIYDSGDR